MQGVIAPGESHWKQPEPQQRPLNKASNSPLLFGMTEHKQYRLQRAAFRHQMLFSACSAFLTFSEVLPDMTNMSLARISQ